MVEVDRRVAGVARRIDVDDLQIFADRPGLEIFAPKARVTVATLTSNIVGSVCCPGS